MDENKKGMVVLRFLRCLRLVRSEKAYKDGVSHISFVIGKDLKINSVNCALYLILFN